MLNFLLTIAEESQREKIEQLYRAFHMDMLRFASSRLKLHGRANYSMDAEDVVQNSFVKITKYIHAIDFTLSQRELKSYVLTIVANEINNFLNENIMPEVLEESLSEEDFFAELRIKERYAAVVSAIERLDERYFIRFLRDS